MGRLLVVSYHFPPEPGVASQRVAKLAKYLRRSGWDVAVVTALEPAEQDPDLAADVDGIETIRVAAPDSSTLQRAGWAMRALGTTRDVARRSDIALISGGPFAPFALGPRLGIPYVLDFRDHWSAETRFGRLGPGLRGALRRGLEGTVEHRVIGAAAAVISVAPEITAHTVLHGARRAETVRHGYDPDDLASDVERAARPTLAHVGSMRLGERTPELLLAVAREVRAAGTDIAVRLVGPVAPEYEPLVAPARDEGWLTVVGRVPHRRAVREMQQATALWIEPGEEPYLITGKVYEHLAAATPIVARASPQGALAALLDRTGGGLVVANGPAAAAEAVAEAVAGRVPARDEEAVASLALPHVADRLSTILEESR